MIVCLTPPQMNDFCDLLGTPDSPVSKIASVKIVFSTLVTGKINQERCVRTYCYRKVFRVWHFENLSEENFASVAQNEFRI